MSTQALRCGNYEPPTTKQAVSRDGGGTGRDQRRAGSGAKTEYGAYQGSLQGPGDGGPQSLDRLLVEGERKTEDVGGRPEREAERGGGIDGDSFRREVLGVVSIAYA